MYIKAIDNSCICSNNKYITCDKRDCINHGIASYDVANNKNNILNIIDEKYSFDNNISKVRRNVKFVLNLFNINNGFYVDIGAFEGFCRSNTYPLQTIGWSGICVEPIPHRNWGKRLQLSKGTCILVKDIVYNDNNLILDWAYNHNCGGVLIDNKKKSKIVKQIGPTKTLEKILDENNSPKFINFIDIDTEGSEYKIIEKFPFDKYKFGIIMIEYNNDLVQHEHIKNLLENNNYKLVAYDNIDMFFVNNSL